MVQQTRAALTMAARQWSDPYATLGLTRDANHADIRIAWKKAALRTHPDKAGDDGAQFKKVMQAYEYLRGRCLHKSAAQSNCDGVSSSKQDAQAPHQQEHKVSFAQNYYNACARQWAEEGGYPHRPMQQQRRTQQNQVWTRPTTRASAAA